MTEKTVSRNSASTFKKLLSFLWLTADSDRRLSIRPKFSFLTNETTLLGGDLVGENDRCCLRYLSSSS